MEEEPELVADEPSTPSPSTAEESLSLAEDRPVFTDEDEEASDTVGNTGLDFNVIVEEYDDSCD